VSAPSSPRRHIGVLPLSATLVNLNARKPDPLAVFKSETSERI